VPGEGSEVLRDHHGDDAQRGHEAQRHGAGEPGEEPPRDPDGGHQEPELEAAEAPLVEAAKVHEQPVDGVRERGVHVTQVAVVDRAPGDRPRDELELRRVASERRAEEVRAELGEAHDEQRERREGDDHRGDRGGRCGERRAESWRERGHRAAEHKTSGPAQPYSMIGAPLKPRTPIAGLASLAGLRTRPDRPPLEPEIQVNRERCPEVNTVVGNGSVREEL
jgi:hypothetical protein